MVFEPDGRRRYVVIGAGAVGGVVAAHLVETGHNVVLVARGEHARRIRSRGLVVRRPDGVHTVGMTVAEAAGEVGLSPSDVLFLTVKTQDVESVLAEWAWKPVHSAGGPVGVGADLPVVTFQNGLAAEGAALRRFDNVYGATIAVAASFITPGEVVSPSLPPVAGVIWLGRHPGGRDDVQDSIARDLKKAGFAAFSVMDERCHKAAKLLGSVGNALDLLSGPNDLRDRARILLREEAVVALQAAGIPLTPHHGLDYRGVRLIILPVAGHVPGRFSTWQSFARGATSEVDYLNGEVVLLGRLAGVAVPLNRRAQRLAADPRFAPFRSLAVLLDGTDGLPGHASCNARS
ncbi:2-dehydropantoate 2-reductase N-terminal domain-containing protein [Micromonospora sp. NPDC049662]|uniref:ketopantoate reductase family protein n=1 Tax=Micromonospora sp. NPDC049662 TaxID=3155397 RepID=UPI0034497D41